MIEDNLIQYGMAGIFIIYLIYDRQVLLLKITKALDRNTQVLEKFINKLSH